MEKTSADALNAAFVDQVGNADGNTAVTERGLLYIKKILREESFARKVLPPVNITKFDCQRSVNTDTIVKIVDIEPDSHAASLNFNAEPEATWVNGKRYEIPFHKIQSDWFEKTEAELLAYEMPIVEIIEENTVKDIMEVEDGRFIDYCDLAVTATGQGVDDGGSANLTKTLLIDLFKLIDSNRLKTETILFSTPTYDDVLNFNHDVLGDDLAGKVFVDGYKYQQILGKKMIVTTKSNLVPFGVVYSYTAPKYFGNFFILNDTRFFIKKEADLISWTSWEIIGMGIGNRNGVARLRYSTAAP